MDRFEAAKWMVEHPGQRMVDSDGDEWWFDAGAEDFRLNGDGGALFADCVAPCSFEPKSESIKSHRRKTKPWVDIADNVLVRIPQRFRGKLVELRVEVCDE
jgi:hypothetical protein